MVLALPRPILCETARKFFSRTFSKTNGFIIIFLPLAYRTCSMPRQNFFVPYLLSSHVKYYYSQNIIILLKTGSLDNAIREFSLAKPS